VTVIPATINSIVEVITLGQRRFQQFAAKKIMDHESSDIALPSRWVLCRPLSRGSERPRFAQRASHLIRIELHARPPLF
jgi:hypothetical protein